MSTISIYTDGSCLMHSKKRPGGWGFVLLEPECEFHISGGEINTTNNRMELSAVIEALLFSRKYKEYIIYSDSMYVINCANGKWKRSKNIDLWNKYNKISKNKKITYIWVKGHSGNKYNEIVDKLARKESEDRK